MRQGRFFCNHDVRIDFPFDDTEYMSLWANHDCSDWDLYLTLIADSDTFNMGLTFTGAETSLRRGCYDIYQLEKIGACEFYLPHGGDNFAVLFEGGYHSVWYEYEWDYNPEW